MKNLILLLCLIPVLSFSQVSSWRSNNSRPQISSPAPRIGSPVDGVSSWRNQSPREFNRPQQTKPGSNIIVTDPYWGWNGWGWNRWGMWGAPMFGFNYWNPTWYWNDWGYRQPARVYVYEDGRRDTIKGKKPIVNFVLQKTSNDQIGGSIAIGNKSYFIVDFVSTYRPDNSTYFPYGTIDKVDFPLIKDLKKEASFYLGGGKRFKRTGVHAMIGFGQERVYWRGKDLYGEITFPKYRSNFTTFKFGVMQDIRNISLKVDVDPIRNYWQTGIGFNF